jgi:hypothetical protein
MCVISIVRQCIRLNGLCLHVDADWHVSFDYVCYDYYDYYYDYILKHHS